VLISIQSLMSANPFENEPGFEMTKITDKEAEEYAQKVCYIYSCLSISRPAGNDLMSLD
jgi:hypothetical protein